MIKRMNGIKRVSGYPILNDGEITAVKDREKEEMLVNTVLLLKFIALKILVKEGKKEEKKQF